MSRGVAPSKPAKKKTTRAAVTGAAPATPVHGGAHYFPSPAAFRDWLRAHGAGTDELLVGFHKVGSGEPSMTWPQSVDEALCEGWIDGVRRRVDDTRYTIRFTPRRAGSHWSRVNIDRIAVLDAEGRLRPAGRAAFEKRDGNNSARASYERSDRLDLPPDLQAQFERQRAAWAFFSAQPPGYRRQMTGWVAEAKQVATRERRLATLIAASAKGERLR